MSFNIRYGSAEDGPNHWRSRQPLVIEAIKRFDPDLLGTQETLKFQAEYLQEQLPDYGSVGRGRQTDPDADEQCTLFFKRDRFDKLAEGHFWLSETPSVPGSKSWDSSLPRMATWVILHDRQSPGRSICFFNTHFDHRGRRAREESARLIAGRIPSIASAENDPWVILTGDFNTSEDDPPYKVFRPGQDGRLLDTYRLVHAQRAGEEGTFGGWTGRRDGPRIDWILVDPRFTTLEAGIETWNQQGRYPSDHYPVTAVLEYRN
jgi:endonuclease/exonuclease/phosphatase family metal-dependent hydrolase